MSKPGSNCCQRLPALLKLLLTLGMILIALALTLERWPALVLLGCVVFTGHSLARVPLSYLLRRLAWFVPFVSGLALAIPAGQGFQSGWDVAGLIVCRSSLSLLAVLWLNRVMSLPELLQTLHRLYCPAVLVAGLAFMLRYGMVLWEELERMQRARLARTFGRRSLLFRWRVQAQCLGMLLLRSLDRADRIHAAMQARGWTGQVRFYPPDQDSL